MPIYAYFILAFIVILIFCVCLTVSSYFDSLAIRIVSLIAFFALSIGFYGALNWYYTETEPGKMAAVDEQTRLFGNPERTVNILNADGKIIKSYTGIIDIEDNDGGYVIFDLDGKRYMYFNCYVESIAEIGG